MMEISGFLTVGQMHWRNPDKLKLWGGCNRLGRLNCDMNQTVAHLKAKNVKGGKFIDHSSENA